MGDVPWIISGSPGIFLLTLQVGASTTHPAVDCGARDEVYSTCCYDDFSERWCPGSSCQSDSDVSDVSQCAADLVCAVVQRWLAALLHRSVSVTWLLRHRQHQQHAGTQLCI